MNFLSFEYVLAIRKNGTIRGAARERFISPQSLSEHLGKLERELGAPLFYRTNPMTLTEAGERFAACAESCLEAKRRLEAELEAIAEKNDRHIALGVPTRTPPLLLNFLAYFRNAHPELTLSAVEVPTRTGAFHELPGHIDAVISEFQEENGKLLYTPVLRSNRFVVAIHRELLGRWAGPERTEWIAERAHAGAKVELSEFRDCPFVLKQAGSITRSNEDRLFRAAGFWPKGDMETGDMELSVRLVRSGGAALFLPEPVARANLVLSTAADDAVLLCPVAAEGEWWQLAVGFSRSRPVPRGVSVLTEAAKSFYQSALGDF